MFLATIEKLSWQGGAVRGEDKVEKKVKKK